MGIDCFTIWKKIDRDAFYRLKLEKNVQLDFGTHFKVNKLNILVSSYFGYIKDFILYRYYNNILLLNDETVVNGSCSENVNAIIRGSEIGFSYNVNDNWNLENNISWVFGKNITNFSSLPQISPLEGTVKLKWENDLWNSMCIWRIISSQSQIAINTGNVIIKGMSVSKRFSIFSINVLKKVSKEVKLGMGIDNVFNKRYREHLLNLNGNTRFNDLNNSSLSESGYTWWFHMFVVL